MAFHSLQVPWSHDGPWPWFFPVHIFVVGESSWAVVLFMRPSMDFPGGASGKESACQFRRHKRCRFYSWVRKIPWRRARQPIAVLLPGESHLQRSLVGYSPWGHKELDTSEATERSIKGLPSLTPPAYRSSSSVSLTMTWWLSEHKTYRYLPFFLQADSLPRFVWVTCPALLLVYSFLDNRGSTLFTNKWTQEKPTVCGLSP